MIYRFGVFELDVAAGELRRGGTRLPLTGQPIRLLGYLIERRGEVISRGELQRALWSEGTWVDFEHGLNNAINKLRFALRDSSALPRYIETLPRRGYRFIATIETSEGQPVAQPLRKRVLPLFAAAAAVAVVLIGGGAFAVKQGRATARASAHEAYVKGREELVAENAEATARARAYFERAIRIDENYAPAHCGMAMAFNRAGLALMMNPDEAHRRAIAAANRALELDPKLAEAHVARATARLRLSWDWRGAEADLRRAMSLDPDFVKPHQTWAVLLLAQGRPREALREIGTARQLDPLSPSLRREEAVILYHARQYDAAIAGLQAVLGSNPRDATARRVLADAYVHSGNAGAAHREFLQWLELVGVNQAEVERARANLRQGGFAALWQRTVSGSPKKGHAWKTAVAFASLGRRDEAIRALEEAFANREAQVLYLRTDPYLDQLRNDARFMALMKRARM